MNRMKKFASLLLALVMALALAVPAMAAGNEGTNTISLPIEMVGRTVEVYQIFKGTQADTGTDNAKLADIQWGTGIKAEEFVADLVGSNEFGTTNPFAGITYTEADPDASAEAVAKVLANDASFNSAQAIAFTRVAQTHLDKYTQSIDVTEEVHTITGLPTGYYLIVDKTVVGEGENNAVNAALLQLTSDVTIKAKVDVPKVDKQVQEDTTGEYGDGADYSIGDTVPFKFLSNVPDMTQFETYKYIFHDEMDAGLTFNSSSVEVKIGGNVVEQAGNYEVVTNTDHCTFEIEFANLKNVPGAVKDAKIEITFNATLNNGAVIGTDGNLNKVVLEYSNNPKDGGDGETGKTPEDVVAVFTYELDVNKIDGSTKANLANAEFVLMDSYDEANGRDAEGVKYAVVETIDGKDRLTGWTENRDEATTLKSDANGNFTVYGLDAGTYYLKETKAPAGYNTPEKPFKLEITRTGFTKDENGVTYHGLSITITDLNKPEPAPVPGTVDNEAGTVATTIENNSGIVLPETGGIGTTIFYVLGGLLTLGAVVLLVTKKRMSVEEK